MDIKEVKNNLNKDVTYKGVKGLYKLTGCTLRKNEKGIFYQAEILDKRNGNSVLVVSLDDIAGCE